MFYRNKEEQNTYDAAVLSGRQHEERKKRNEERRKETGRRKKETGDNTSENSDSQVSNPGRMKNQRTKLHTLMGFATKEPPSGILRASPSSDSLKAMYRGTRR